METHKRPSKKFWKPPSFEDFNSITPSKKLKLDNDDFWDEIFSEIPNEVAEPKTISDLAVHSKKIEEIKQWMKRSKNIQAPILLVTGPAGSGKTTTIKVAANAEGFSVKEWVNPADKSEFKSENMIENEIYDRFNFLESKQTEKFNDFVFKSSRYTSFLDNSDKILILVEDIPNIFIWKPKQFFEFLERYKNLGKSPLVFVVTDDKSLNLQNDLFPANVRSKYSITNVKFNPINNSSLIKNLKHLAELYCSEKVSPTFLENISKNSGGDIRSAINDLLLFLRTNDQIPKLPKTKAKKKDGIWSGSKSITLKDSSFDFYQIIGRVLYPKMLGENEKPQENPNRMFLYDVHQISENFNNSSLSILHENYLQTFRKLSDVVKSSDIFSVCDVLNSHQELEVYRNLCSVIGLMCRKSEPKKTGFNPMKKPFHLKSQKSFNDLDERIDLVNFGLSERNLLLDVIPFLRIFGNKKIEQNLQLKCDKEKKESDVESEDDNIEIEDFDD